MKLKIKALMKHLDIDEAEAERLIDRGDYDILNDKEAQERATDFIKDTLWAFNPDFLISYIDSFDKLDRSTCKEILSGLQAKCESANAAILNMVGNNLDYLVEDVIGCDGRGHFLSNYDGEEHEITVTEGNEIETYYIYRNN